MASGAAAADPGAAAASRERDAAMRASADSPEALAAMEAASATTEFLQVLETLTASDGPLLRGCQVNPDRAHLQALQNMLDWTIGGYDTRPTPEAAHLKQHDRLEVLINYRQPADPGMPPRVAMYDYICDTLFAVPMRPVGPEVTVPQYQRLDGQIVDGAWKEADWEAFKASGKPKPAPVFGANRYPYQVRMQCSREDAHAFQQRAQHWILWYFHFPWEPPANPSDAEIDQDLRRELQAVVTAEHFERADYIWYRNPGMSVPEVFHVQVFWIVPDDAR